MKIPQGSILLLLLLLLNCRSSAQKNDSSYYQFGKKDVQISVGYGMPSAVGGYLKVRERTNPNQRKLTSKGYGPQFLKLEYGISQRFSVLLNAYYNFSDIYWTQNARNPTTGLQEPYRHGVEAWEVGLSLRTNYYFLKRKNWNCYGGLGVGRGYAELETYTLAPKERVYISFEEPGIWNFEGTIGARYFLAKNIALFSEVGIGQSWYLFKLYYIPSSIIQLGFSVKL